MSRHDDDPDGATLESTAGQWDGGTRYLKPGDRVRLIRRDTAHVLTEPHYVVSVSDAERHITLTATDAGTIQWGGGANDDEDPDDAA